MLGDVGIAFKFTGADKALTQMRRLKGEYGALSHAVDQGGKRIGGSFTGMSGMIKAAAAGAIVSMGALTAAAVAIPYKLATAREELSRLQGDLRALQMPEGDIRQSEESFRKYTDRWAGATKEALTQGFYDIHSTVGHLSAKTKIKMMEDSALAGKAMKMQAGEAADYAMSMWGALKDQYKDTTPEEFIQRMWAMSYKAVQVAKTTGPKIRESLSQVAPVAGLLKWQLHDLLAPIALLQTGGLKPEAAGTALRNIMTRAPEALAKVMAESQITRGFGEGAWDKLKGEKKEELLKRAKKAIAESGILKQGPLTFFSTLQEQLAPLGELRRMELLKELFGDESIAGATKLMQGLEKLRELRRDIKGGEFSEVEEVNRRMNVGIHTANDLMKQRWKNLTDVAGIIFEAPVGGAMDAISQRFVKNADMIQAKNQELKAGLTSLSSGMVSSFMATFAPLKSTSQWMNQVERFLQNPPPPEKWREIGDELGRLAGKNLGPVARDIETIAKAVVAAARAMHPFLQGVRWVGDNVARVRDWLTGGSGNQLDAAKKQGSLLLKSQADLDIAAKLQRQGPRYDPLESAGQWLWNKGADLLYGQQPKLSPVPSGPSARMHMSPMGMMGRELDAKMRSMGPGAQTSPGPQRPIEINLRSRVEIDGKAVGEASERHRIDQGSLSGLGYAEGLP